MILKTILSHIPTPFLRSINRMCSFCFVFFFSFENYRFIELNRHQKWIDVFLVLEIKARETTHTKEKKIEFIFIITVRHFTALLISKQKKKNSFPKLFQLKIEIKLCYSILHVIKWFHATNGNPINTRSIKNWKYF